jgi:hypothetical protein
MNALISSFKDFATNPFGAMLIAILTAACWDLVKLLWSRWFTLEGGLLKKIAKLKVTLERFENGTFIVDMLHGALFVIILSAFAVILAMFQVTMKTGALDVPNIWINIAFVLFVVVFLGINYILGIYRNYFVSICYTSDRIHYLHKQIAKIPKSERNEWIVALNQIVEKAEQLKLLGKK